MVKISLALFVILAAIAVPGGAQNPPQAASNMGTFRARMVDPDSGQLIAEPVTLVITKEGESAATRREIDVKGEFVLSDLAPGRYWVSFRYKGIEFDSGRYVQVTALSATTPTSFYLRLLGEITGIVADEAGKPVQGSQVLVVTIRYFAGQAVYTVYTGRKTDDRGFYSISPRVEAGLPYFMLALPPEQNRPTLSGTPSFQSTWYPGRPGFVQPFVLQSAERKHVDFVLEKRPTYCVDGKLTNNGNPAGLIFFEIAIPEVAGYLGQTGGTQGVISRGQSDAEGHFQACGLWSGEFLLAAGLNSGYYGHATVSIGDRDIHDLTLNVPSTLTLAADIHLDGAQAPARTYRLSIFPFSRVAFENQPFMGQYKDVTAPSQSTIFLLASTDYMIGLRALDGTSDAYVKEVACGGSIRRDSLKLGDSDCGLRITIGTDMGKLVATIVDKDNNNDLNSLVCVYPTSAATREEIASTGICSPAEPGTTSVSIPLRPDRYTAVVVPHETVDWVEYVISNRGQVSLTDVPPRSTVQLTLRNNTAR